MLSNCAKLSSKQSIQEKIQAYLEQGYIPFHSPAHCGQENAHDLSELTGLDELQYPQNLIKENQELIAQLFGAQKSFFLINGASVGIMAALLSLKKTSQIQNIIAIMSISLLSVELF